MFRMADCAIVNELDEVDWFSLLVQSGKRMDYCVDLFYEMLILYNEYADVVWVPSDPGPDLMQDDPPFGGALQFTVDEVQSVLLELDVSKNACPDGIPPLILKNCASAFARSLSLLFNRSLSKCLPTRLLQCWDLSKDCHSSSEIHTL
jgi:hypothetical protein